MSAPRPSEADVEAFDGPCDQCEDRYPAWWVDHAIWNRVMGGPDATDDPGGLLCPTCFLRLAGKVRGAWKIIATAELAARDAEREREVAAAVREALDTATEVLRLAEMSDQVGAWKKRAEAAERALADLRGEIRALWEKWQTFDVAGNARAHWMTDLDDLRALLPRDDAAGGA